MTFNSFYKRKAKALAESLNIDSANDLLINKFIDSFEEDGVIENTLNEGIFSKVFSKISGLDPEKTYAYVKNTQKSVITDLKIKEFFGKDSGIKSETKDTITVFSRGSESIVIEYVEYAMGFFLTVYDPAWDKKKIKKYKNSKINVKEIEDTLFSFFSKIEFVEDVFVERERNTLSVKGYRKSSFRVEDYVRICANDGKCLDLFLSDKGAKEKPYIEAEESQELIDVFNNLPKNEMPMPTTSVSGEGVSRALAIDDENIPRSELPTRIDDIEAEREEVQMEKIPVGPKKKDKIKKILRKDLNTEEGELLLNILGSKKKRKALKKLLKNL